MSRRVYEGRCLGGGRWEVRRRPRWVSTPVRACAGLAVAAGGVHAAWERLDAQARAAVVLAAAAVAWLAWRVWKAAR